MSGYVAERIQKPPWFSISRLVRGRGERERQYIGFDSEQDTTTGDPMLFQYSVTGGQDAVELQEIRAHDDPLALFMSWVHRNCTNKRFEYVILGWNLQYEFTQLFARLPIDVKSESEWIVAPYTLRDASGNMVARFTLTVANDKRFFIKIRNEATHRTITFCDGMAFYVTSLDNASKMLGLGQKLKITTKKFTRADLASETFRDYARQDAWLTRMIGENINDLHEQYDVTTCLTAPQFAAKVFRHHFLKAKIDAPDPQLEQAGLWTYHGGVNGYYAGKPRAFANVYAYDITSAYPEAMRQLPNPETADWDYRLRYEPGLHALWHIRGTYQACAKSNLLREASGTHPSGPINAWLTSYEIDQAVALGELTITGCEGWVMSGESGGPLVEYVDRFFDMKRKAKGAMREAAKLFLNSLYGKFFQKVALGIVGTYALDEDGEDILASRITTDPDAEYDHVAGGLYHPPIASLITGFVRAKIHRLEHKYDALHTSTDGIFAIVPPDPADIGTDLGKLTVKRGHLRIWRERLYVFTPSIMGALESGATVKRSYALHGFRGTLRDLLRLPLDLGKFTYYAQAMITNKLARNAYHGRRYAPGSFVILPFTLAIGEDRAPP